MIQLITAVLVLIVVATVLANLISGSVHNDLNNPHHPAAKKLNASFNNPNKKVLNASARKR